MPTRDNIVSDVKGLIGTDPNISDAEIQTLVQLRYDSIYEAWNWSKSLRDFTISLVAQIKNGTGDKVSVTNGSATVTSAGTPFTSAMGGRQIQIGSEAHFFYVSFVSSSQITLQDGESVNVNWPLATASAQTWRIFQTIYTLPTTIDSVWSLSAGGDRVLDELDGGRLSVEEWDSDRSETADPPRYWFYAGVNSSGTREIDFWPTPSAARLLRGQGWRRPPTLAATTDIDIPRAVLVFATAADVAGMLHAKTGDESHRNNQLFFERKYGEEERKAKPMDVERLSLPKTIKRKSQSLTSLRGTDFEVDHDLGSVWD